MRNSLISFASILIILAGCNPAGQQSAPSPEAADFVFTNGKVYTIDASNSWAEAVAVRGSEIVYVGDAAGAEALVGEGTRRIDLAGKTVLPGFVSAHDHFIASNWTQGGVQLFDLESKEAVLARVREYADAHPDEKVIRGIGWSAGKFGGNPLATELDEAVPDRPAILLDFTVHDAWLNTRAFEEAGVTKDSPDVLPGVTFWVRDDEGNPTGTAIEGQWFKPFLDIGAWQPETMIPESMDFLYRLAASNGVTAMQNTGIVTPNLTDTHGGMETDFKVAMEILHNKERDGTLLLRTFPLPFFKNRNADPVRAVDFAASMRELYNSDMLRVQAIKLHPEGNWTAEVAPFIEPYVSGKVGEFNVEPDKMKALILEAARQGFDVMTHSDSDGTARASVDGIIAARAAGYPDIRSAIHHATWVSPEDQRKIIENKIPVNATPSFTNDWSGTDDNALRLLGEKRVEDEFGKYPDFARAGVSVSISSDVPSTPPSMEAPMYVIEVATTMTQPEDPNSRPFPPHVKPMTIEQAIRSHTIEAAWQIHMEDKIGSLEVGKYADLVVLDRNPFDVDLTELSKIDVLMTMMNGRFTYQADSGGPGEQ